MQTWVSTSCLSSFSSLLWFELIVSDIQSGSCPGRSEMWTMLLLPSVLRHTPFYLFLLFRPTANFTGKSKGIWLINYNDHANQYNALFQSFPLLCTKLCFGVCFRLQEVSGKCQHCTSGKFKTVHWWFYLVLSCVVRLLSRIPHSVICRVVMMKPTVSSPTIATLVSCFSLSECRIKLLDRVVCLALWCNFCKTANVARTWTGFASWKCVYSVEKINVSFDRN